MLALMGVIRLQIRRGVVANMTHQLDQSGSLLEITTPPTEYARIFEVRP